MSDMFDGIIGYRPVKRELSTIIGWYTDPGIDPSLRLPRGILLVGDPGMGKTLFMRAIREAAPLPVYPYTDDGEEGHAAAALFRLYETAAQEANGAIILIDELDALLEKDKKVIRILKERMDGLEPQKRVLFIATANRPFKDNDPLARPGRFDRTIWLLDAGIRDRRDILLYYLKKHGQSLPQGDLDPFVERIQFCSNAQIAAIVTDACLRRGGAPVDLKMLERSYDTIYFSQLPDGAADETPSLSDCVHEIGHAVLIHHYRAHYTLCNISMARQYGQYGACYCKVNNPDNVMDVTLEEIEIGLGGYLAKKILLGLRDSGAVSDLLNARLSARCLVNTYGFFGADKVLREYDTDCRNESWISCRRNERLATKIVRRCERRAARIIRQNRDVILRLAKELQQGGYLNGERVAEVLSGSEAGQRRHA